MIFFQTKHFLHTKQVRRGFWNAISTIHVDLIFALLVQSLFNPLWSIAWQHNTAAVVCCQALANKLFRG